MHFSLKKKNKSIKKGDETQAFIDYTKHLTRIHKYNFRYDSFNDIILLNLLF